MTRNNTYPKIYVFKEKHGEMHYLLGSQEAEDKMFLEVLTQRNGYNYYGWMKDYHPYGVAPSFTLEEIDLLPPSMVHEARKLRSDYNNWQKKEEVGSAYRFNYINVQEAIETQNAGLAKSLLTEFCANEYEGFQQVSFTHFK